MHSKLRQKNIIKGINDKTLAAWEELYRSYYPALCSYAENMVKAADAAEDIVQELLVNIWRSERTFGAMEELTFFLYKAVYNNALHYLRTQKIHANILSKIQEDEPFDDSRFAETIREELLRNLYLQIENLPSERRKIILLSLEGHNREEIAAILGISPNTVKAQKVQAMKVLRDALKNTPLIFFL